jgi:pyrimidine-nucleoside phosphorylase
MRINTEELIRKKRDGGKLDRAEIELLIRSYARGEIPDYQFAAFLMAVYFQGLDPAETADFTQAMINSGRVLDLSDIKKPKIDKHSTGGVGDKVSLILAPLMASCGVCVPMISGRGLGHTGGTLDKLESIPGFRTDLSLKKFRAQLRAVGTAMIGQTSEIAPADRKIYALRDVTATVDSIPLISASIMSKKLAEGLDGLVLDVKFGSGAFLPKYQDAKRLARVMIRIGKRFGVRVKAVMTDMNSPLGICVGNSLEVIETIEALKGRGSPDLMEVAFALGELMLRLARIKGGRRLLAEKIASGAALEKFREVIQRQGGDAGVIDDYSRLPVSRRHWPVKAMKSGFVAAIDTYRVGVLATELGAGRLKKEDRIDPSCGFRIFKKVGDRVRKEEKLAEVISDNRAFALSVQGRFGEVYKITDRRVKKPALIREII